MNAITTRDKLEERIRRTPTPSDVTFNDFVLFLRHNGFTEQTNQSSHYVYGCKINDHVYLIQFVRAHGASNYMKRNYVKKAIETIDEMRTQLEME